MRSGAQLSELDPAECLALLAQVAVGRMVFTEGAHPTVHPVNFSLDGQDVIVRTGGGGKLDAAIAGGEVAFEADELDPSSATGWSVVVVGAAELITDIESLVALADPRHRPWAPGRTGHVIRIRPSQITGRRLHPHLDG